MFVRTAHMTLRKAHFILPQLHFTAIFADPSSLRNKRQLVFVILVPETTVLSTGQRVHLCEIYMSPSQFPSGPLAQSHHRTDVIGFLKIWIWIFFTIVFVNGIITQHFPADVFVTTSSPTSSRLKISAPHRRESVTTAAPPPLPKCAGLVRNITLQKNS